MIRIYTGISFSILFLVLFIFNISQSINEFQKAESLPQVLDKQIPIEKIQLEQNSYMVDHNGNVFSEIYGMEKRIYLNHKQIPELVKNIFIAVEDQLFYKHKGFDITGIVRAALINAQEHSIEQGGSTITQQLARNLYLTNEKTYNRKLSELLYSYQLERKLSKEQILELYINQIYFQHGIYGIEAASQYYFSLPTAKLSLAQLAFLCAIPNNPTYYDPITNFENTKERQLWILQKLLEQRLITQTEYGQAIKENIILKLKNEMDLYVDYATYIFYELKELISEKEGFKQKIETASPKEKEAYINELNNRYQEVIHSGITIHTALDRSIQETAKRALNENLPYSDIEGAAVVIDHSNQQIVALTGGKNYQKFDFHRSYQAYRQPGSAIKPLLVYSPFINERNASQYTIVNGGPFCKNGFCPQNYGGAVYGNISLSTALKYSYNTAAVRLLDRIGVKTAFTYLNPFQFTKVTNADHTLAAALGGFKYGVTPLELTNAYTTFAHDGNYRRAFGIKAVTDHNGKVLYSWDKPYVNVWSKRTNETMRTMLAEVVKNGTARKAYFPSSYIGGKTGTTNNYKDLWFVGLTDRYTAGVWVGKDKPASIQRIDYQTPQLSIWKTIMKKAHENKN